MSPSTDLRDDLPLAGTAWRLDAGGLAAGGIDRTFVASDEECRQIARALEIVACRRLEATVTLRPIGQRRFRLRGRLQAEVEQACVLTLQPVIEALDEPIETEFWPEDQLAEPPADPETIVDPTAEEGPEPIRGGVIDLGAFLFEVLAVSIDPYPRAPGAVFEPAADPDAEAAAAEHPFAKLAALKRDKPE
jgi:uncharacterized metal-binding protein YceD (DUF177 family)